MVQASYPRWWEFNLNNFLKINVFFLILRARQATMSSPSLFISLFLHLFVYFYLQLHFLLQTSVHFLYSHKLSSVSHKSVVDTNFCLLIFLSLPPLVSSQYHQCRMRAAHPVGDKQKLDWVAQLVTLRSQILGLSEITKTNKVNLHGFCTDTFFFKWFKLDLKVY